MLHDAGHAVLSRAGRQPADAEIGGVEQALLLAGLIAQKKDAANFVGGEAVEQFSILATGRYAGDGDAHFRGIARLIAPQHSARHESRSRALRLPGVAALNLHDAIAQRLAVAAFDRPDRTVPQLYVQLILREVCERITHSAACSVENVRGRR